MRKYALFVFNGDPTCFVHVLLNALDMNARGDQAQIVVEGAATGLLPKLAKADFALHKLWGQALDAGLVAGVCQACAGKMGTLAAAQEQGLTLLSDMSGHPSMAGFRERGFEIISF